MSTAGTSRWTQDEIDDAHAMAWDVFKLKNPHRTQEAYHTKRKRSEPSTVIARAISSATVTVRPSPASEDYESMFALLENADEAKLNLAPTQVSTEVAFPDDDKPIAIAFTGDWHCGSSGVLYKQLRIDLEIVRDTDGLYAIGMGDFIEGVTTHSKAATALYSGLFNEPGLQERYAILRAELARGKWLAIMEGNHDGWSYNHAGISRTDKLAAHLGAPFFPQGGGTVFLSIGSQRYVVAVRHNTSGNSRTNTNAHRRAFDEWPLWENCDVIAVGHLHFNDMHIASRKSGRCVYLRSGTYKVNDAYARDRGFTSEYGVPVAIFFPDEKKVIAFRGDDFQEAVTYLRWLRGQ